MTIKVNINDVVYNIRNISHLETANVKDVETRYNIEAGTEKLEEIKRCVYEAESLIRLQMDRFLSNVEREPWEEDTESFIYTFIPSLRTQRFREDIVKGIMENVLTNMALSTFYASVAQTDFSSQHNQLAAAGLMELEKLYFDKKPPMRP